MLGAESPLDYIHIYQKPMNRPAAERRESFSFRIGAEFRNAMNAFKQFRKGDGLKEHALCHHRHKLLFTP
jgi:hypothetical protein